MRVICADALEWLAAQGEGTLDAIVTDPPYGLEFMGKEFDTFGGPAEYQDWTERWGKLALRALKPGGYLLAFGGTRTFHRLACGLEDEGYCEIAKARLAHVRKHGAKWLEVKPQKIDKQQGELF